MSMFQKSFTLTNVFKQELWAWNEPGNEEEQCEHVEEDVESSEGETAAFLDQLRHRAVE